MEINLSWLCVPLGFCMMLPFIVLGTRSRLLWLKRYREAQARGDFDEKMNAPDLKQRIRNLMLVVLTGWVGVAVLVVLLFLRPSGALDVSIKFIVIGLGFFGSLASVGGILVHRE